MQLCIMFCSMFVCVSPWLHCFKCLFVGVKVDNTDIQNGCSHITQILFKSLFFCSSSSGFHKNKKKWLLVVCACCYKCIFLTLHAFTFFETEPSLSKDGAKYNVINDIKHHHQDIVTTFVPQKTENTSKMIQHQNSAQRQLHDHF